MPPNWSRLRRFAEDEIESVVAALPAALQTQVERLPITLEPAPGPELQRDGIKPDTLGLFTGAEFVEEGHVSLPPQIILFLQNLWDVAEGDEATFREETRTTVLHEIGHYLGLNEEELTERGLE